MMTTQLMTEQSSPFRWLTGIASGDDLMVHLSPQFAGSMAGLDIPDLVMLIRIKIEGCHMEQSGRMTRGIRGHLRRGVVIEAAARRHLALDAVFRPPFVLHFSHLGSGYCLRAATFLLWQFFDWLFLALADSLHHLLKVFFRTYSTHCSNMPAKKDIASTSAQRWEGWPNRCKFWTPSSEKPTELLNEQEFRECFCIPNGVSVHLVDGDPTSIEKAAQGAIFFSKEQFNVGLRFPLHLSSSNSCITPKFLLPTFTLTSSGADGMCILNILFHLDLSLLEVLFVYTIKKGKKDILACVAHIPPLQLVIGLPDSNKGGAKGHVLVRGP
ncbi:hypothetical protein CK203_116029 [Vitis vinifera]|uniref:Uncharacterized protein n=1 Tax=Vitis vinifera TaxID=29760 RepID=A0A438C4V8_VITVI|nr:hypothetical protein CK203_116029 [Vitis vinifera]